MRLHLYPGSPGRLILILPFVYLLLHLSSCEKSAKVTDFSSEGEVNLYTSFNWKFDTPLAPVDSVGKWFKTEFARFTPELEGRFKWNSPSELHFSPEGPLEPATDYQVVLTDRIAFGKQVEIDQEIRKFHSPYFKILNASVRWDRSEVSYWGLKSPVKAKVSFNYPVNAYTLDKYVEVTLEGEPVSKFDVRTYGNETEHALVWDAEEVPDSTQCYIIRIKKGLLPEFDRSPLAEDYLTEISLPPLTELKVTDVEQTTEYNNARIDVSTSQPVDPHFIESFVEVYPKTSYVVEEISEGFRIRGDFIPGTQVRVSLRNGCPGLMGGVLEEDWAYELTMPVLKPFLRFTDVKGAYLLRNGEENISVSCGNLHQFIASTYEIYENNLIQFLDKNSGQFRRYNWYDNQFDYYYDYGSYVTLRNFGRLISQDTFKVDLLGKTGNDGVQHVPVDLKKQLKSKYKGIFAMEVNSDSDYWMRDRKVISLSDLGIIAKKTDEEVIVFVNALSTARPIGGVTVKVISETNQTLFTGVTDGSGAVRFRNIDRKAAGFAPRLITVTYGDDLNFLDLDRTRQRTGRFSLRSNSPLAGDVDLFIYGDRNLYRPGDTAHIAGILRNWDFSTAANVPLKIEVTAPNGTETIKTKLKTNRQGSFALEIPLATDFGTGYYYVQVSDGTDRNLKSYSFQVEEFVPDKIKVALDVPDSVYQAAQTVRLPVEASYFFGTVCAEHTYEVTFVPRARQFSSERFPDYRFFNDHDYDFKIPEVKFKGTLDSLGHDTIEYTIPQPLLKQEGLEVTAVVSVFDNTGRAVYRNQQFTANFQDHYLGIKSPGSSVNQYDNATFSFAGVDYRDQPLEDQKVVVEVRRMEYRRALRQDAGGMKYVSEKEGIILHRDTIALGPKVHDLSLRMENTGDHVVSIKDVFGKAYTERKFTVFGPKIEESESFATDPEGDIVIIADKESYRTGETARLVFSTPFSGRMLVTVERDKVYQYFYLDVPRKTATLNLPLNAGYVPNIYVSATLFRPQRNTSNIVLTKAQGYLNLDVKESYREMDIRIDAPELVEPGTRPIVTVRGPAGQDLMVTLAAVDEGILAIKGFETPDPFSYFYAARKLLVDSYDLYRFLLPEVPSAEGATGGGGGPGLYDMRAGNFNPITAKRFRPMAFWSGLVEAGPDGVARIPIDIPKEFNGRIRLMAVAHTGSRFGRATDAMTARDDVVMVPGLPRFVTTGDSMFIPLNLMNATQDSVKVRAKLTVAGPLVLDGPAEQELSLGAQAAGTVGFPVRTTKGIGVGKLRFELSGDEDRVQEFELAVRPPAAFESVGGTGSIKAGESKEFTIPVGYYPEIQSSRIMISHGFALKFAEHIDYLLSYPHGCSEQLTSQLFPQLYLPEIAALVAPDLLDEQDPTGQSKLGKTVENIRNGIKRLEGRVNYNGSVDTWPGGSSYSWWTTAYVTHFLVEAKKKAYPVNENTLARMLDYLKDQCGQQSTEIISYYDANGYQQEEKVKKELVYSLYVLALAEQPELSIMNLYKSKPEKLAWESKVLLAGAFSLIGNEQAFQALIPKDLMYERPERRTGGNFDSEVRSNALVLFVMGTADPDHPLVKTSFEFLEQSLDIISTQDRAWTFLAMGKLAEQKSGLQLNVQVEVDGQKVGAFNGKDWEMTSRNWLGKTVKLTATGDGEANYTWQLRGIPSGAAATQAHAHRDLKVERRILTTQGEEIFEPVFRQGEMFLVELMVYAPRTSIENIALVDLVPAGFEIENGRIRPDAFDFMQGEFNQWDHSDYRDDRALFYLYLSKGKQKKYTYLVRCVSQGKYLYPPVLAEAMYDPGIWCRSGSDTIRILDPEAPLPFRLAPSLHPDCRDAAEERFQAVWNALDEESPFMDLIKRNMLNAPAGAGE